MGIGTTTPLFPLHIALYQSSYQTYKFLNYNGLGGPGGYTNNYSIYCSYAVCASEFNAISDIRIKTNINNLDEIATRRAMKIHSLNITTAKNSLFNCALSGILQTVLRSRGKIFRVGCATLKE